MVQRFLCLVIGYFFGCILTAELIVRHKTGRSVSEYGTGNPGMANVMHIFGFRCGAAVLAGDLAKTAAACILSYIFFSGTSFAGDGIGRLAVLWAGMGAVIGHNWPFWRSFRGGKGVAVTCLAIFLFSPLWGLIADVLGMITVFSTGYLPLGAVVITFSFSVFTVLFSGPEASVLSLILSLIMLSRHWRGLVRILHGSEKKNAQFFKRHK